MKNFIVFWIFLGLFVLAAFSLWLATGGVIETCPSGYTLVTHPWSRDLGQNKSCEQIEAVEKVCPEQQSFREAMVLGLVFGIPAVFIFMFIVYGADDGVFLVKVFIFCVIVAVIVVFIQDKFFADHWIVVAQKDIMQQFGNFVAPCK